MNRERVADNVYVFTSDLYAQVNAGAVIGPDWAVVIDTLAMPEETLEMKEFIEDRLDVPVKYVINTHYHSDHTNGNCWFPEATVISHAECRRLMSTYGRQGLARARSQSRELEGVSIVLPSVVFEEGGISIQVGKRTLELIPLPGHSPDGIGVFIVEERVLFSGDVMMSLPYLLHGSPEAMLRSFKVIARLKLESLVQGHGEVILRGEVVQSTKENAAYVNNVLKHVRIAQRRRDPQEYLTGIDVESAGKSRILLNGLAEELHQRNLLGVFQSQAETADE